MHCAPEGEKFFLGLPPKGGGWRKKFSPSGFHLYIAPTNGRQIFIILPGGLQNADKE